ncbi:MAG: aldose 1-epimerase family protein [Gallionella sp.]
MVSAAKVLIGDDARNRQELMLSAADIVESSEKFSVIKRTLQGGLRGGMEIIEVDNGRMRFWVLPERGMGIWKAWMDGIEIGWQSPVRGPVHPKYVPIHDESGLGWLGGFDELLCRCGLESNGAPEFDSNGKLKYPLHGKIANLPAYKVAAGVDSGNEGIRLDGCIEESRFKFQKLQLHAAVSTRLASSEIVIHDKVANTSDSRCEFQLLYHINFGKPFLDAGSEVFVPLKTLVPRTHNAAEAIDHWSKIAAPEAGFVEQVYFMELLGDEAGRTQILLANSTRTLGVSLHFNLSQLPCFTLWKNTASVRDGYVVGLEPGINFPNPRSYEQVHGRVATLLPGEAREFDLRLEFHVDSASVTKAQHRIAEYQAALLPTIHRTMQTGWSIEAG